MPSPRPSTRTSAAALAVGVLLAACGGATAPSDPAVAQQLAQSADEVADLLDSGQLCEARQAADDLIAATREAEAAGQLAEPIADDVVETTVAATAEATCAPAPDEGDSGGGGSDGGGSPGKSKGKGKKKGKD